MSFESAVEDYRHGRLEAARRKLAAIDEVRAKLLFVRIYTRLRHTTGVEFHVRFGNQLKKSSMTELRLGYYFRFFSCASAQFPKANVALRKRSRSSVTLLSHLVSRPSFGLVFRSSCSRSIAIWKVRECHGTQSMLTSNLDQKLKMNHIQSSRYKRRKLEHFTF